MSPKPCLVKISPSISNNERRIQNSVSKVRKTHLDEVLKKKKEKKKERKKRSIGTQWCHGNLKAHLKVRKSKFVFFLKVNTHKRWAIVNEVGGGKPVSFPAFSEALFTYYNKLESFVFLLDSFILKWPWLNFTIYSPRHFHRHGKIPKWNVLLISFSSFSKQLRK